MALSLVTQPVNIARKVADVVSQTLVEGDIIVPDIKPDINEVLQVDASVIVDAKEIAGGNAKIKGRLEFSILYAAQAAEDISVASITPTLPFEFQYEVGEIAGDDIVKIRTDVPHVEYHVINSRKLSVKSIVAVNTIAQQLVENELVINVEAPEGEEVECLFETENVYHTLCLTDTQISISEEFELPAGKPPIGEILKYDVRLMPQEPKCITDKIVTKGDMNVLLLYTAALDGSLQYVEFDLSFTEVLSALDMQEDSDVALDYEIQDTTVQMKADYDGDHIYVNIAADLGVSIVAGENREIKLLADCFAPAFETRIEKQAAKVNKSMHYQQMHHSIRDVVEFPEDAPKIRQIYTVSAKPHVKSIGVLGNNAQVEGIIACNILYLSEDSQNPVYSVGREIPFMAEAEIAGDGQKHFDVAPLLTHVSYNMINDSEVETRYNLSLGIKSAGEEELELVSGVELSQRTAVNTEIPSIVIYFVQQEDTLWSIAKKYNVTRQSIISANELTDNPQLAAGQQLLIPKHR